jgi:glutamate synthase (NADPH/NADH)
MTHRGATGADSRDGDGAGVMVGIPHAFFVRESERELKVKLPNEGEYAVGNVFFKKGNDDLLASHKATFSQIAESLNLRVLGWRTVPTDGSILGPAALSREPLILQPVVVLSTHYGDGNTPDTDSTFDEKYFERQLYVLRKHATHTLLLSSGFYICSLSNKNVVYKGQLSPVQVYNYYHDL